MSPELCRLRGSGGADGGASRDGQKSIEEPVKRDQRDQLRVEAEVLGSGDIGIPARSGIIQRRLKKAFVESLGSMGMLT